MTNHMYDYLSKDDIVKIKKSDLDQLLKDRLDFGFDSIYFRYAEACDEIAAYESRTKGTDPIQARRAMNHRKMHFYQTLEQLMHAHDQEDEKNDSNC